MNLAVAIIAFNYSNFGFFSVIWFVFGMLVLVSQIVERRCRWSRVLLILVAAAVGFWINGYMLTEIVNSV